MHEEGQFLLVSSSPEGFWVIKQRLCDAPVLALLNFEELFKVECDASGVGIEAVLTQLKKPLA